MAPDEPSLTARTTSNAVANTLGAIWGTLLAFVATSVIIRAFGVELYGVYVLIAAAAGYISLVELNLSSALVKYVAEHAGRGETRQVEEVIGTTIFLYIILSVAAGGVFVVVGRALLPLLHVPDRYLDMAWRALVISALALPFTLLSNTLGMLPAAVGRFDVTVLANAAIATAVTAAAIVIALSGGQLVPLAIANGAAAVAGTIAYVIIAKRFFPGVSFRPRWSAARGAILLRFSAFSFLGRLSSTLLTTVDRIVIGLILGPAAVAYYAVPAGLVRRVAALVSRMAYVVLPVASELAGRLDHARLTRGYVRSARITWWIAVLLSAALFALSRPLLTLWVGADVAAHSVWVLRLLAVAFLFEAASHVPAVVTDGIGLPKISGGFAVATTLINLLLIVPAVHRFGVTGAAASALIASALTVPLFVDYVQRRLVHLTWRDTLRAIYLPPLRTLRDDLREVGAALRLRR